MNTQLYCPDEARKSQVRAMVAAGDPNAPNGIDYLEVLDSDAPAGTPPQQTLLVHCFRPVSGLGAGNVRLEGGVRVRDTKVLWAMPASDVPVGSLKDYLDATLPQPNRVLVVRTDRRGDFSTYRLRLIQSSLQPGEPPAGFDRLLSAVDFSFKVECPSDFDCKRTLVCPPPELPAPHIDYLAKDYASFRRLMLDRLAAILPDWKERSPADGFVALVEVLAYGADQLSYYQDAVATEAYLDTARRRVSVRRHARLVDYRLHDGANGRAWVCLAVAPGSAADGAALSAGTRLLSGRTGPDPRVPPDQLAAALVEGPTVFETLHAVTLKPSRNRILLHTWGDPNCCLPKGATRAALVGAAADLDLHTGDLLILEEVLGSESGLEVDADPAHRHVVRLSGEPVERTDPVTAEQVLEIAWHDEDALPFPLCLRAFPDGAGGSRPASVAHGNVVLADHGLTVPLEALVPDGAPEDRPYRPRLARSGLTHAMPYDHDAARTAPASAATLVDLRQVLPVVTVQGDGATWRPQRDLLGSDRFSPEFVVEMESDGRASLRFGDGVLGRRPAAGATFAATYRVGSGSGGNVGADALSRVVTDLTGIQTVRNPLPGGGGTAPEPLEAVRLKAPQAFRTQERAVTEADYAAAAQRHRQVQRAAATRRWTGSWWTMFVTVDRTGGRRVDAAFEGELRGFLERFRMAAYDLEIDAPRFVPLDIQMLVCVAPDHFRSDVKQALLELFSNRDLPDGRRGFFHPDNFSFGQSVYLSQLVATAMNVPGVQWVRPVAFQRWGEDPHGELDAGRIDLHRLEIARLDNDPNLPENGRIDFDMQGGL